MNILVPQGIGDSVWAMIKIQGLAKNFGADEINVLINCDDPFNVVECRSLDFIGRFKFVKSARMHRVKIIEQVQRYHDSDPLGVATPEGYYNYIPSGEHADSEIDYVMIPNAPLERGIRLEDWLPECETNWNVMDEWDFLPEELERVEALKAEHGDYVVFHMASLISNTKAGHNRNGLWSPEDWVELGRRIHSTHGLKILIVGGPWDQDYLNAKIRPLTGDDDFWVDMTGKTTSGEVLAVGKGARFIISYQSGIAMVPNYMGTPAAIFWRPRGDSITANPNIYVSFEESMSTAWVNPDNLEKGKFLPLIYGRHDVNYIIDEIEKRNW